MRVVVGLSGGVDSSVAALLLKQQGHEVIGLFMKNWHDTSVTKSDECPWVDDSHDAMIVAQQIGIPFQTLDFSEPYKARIVDYMFAEYEAGRTPNPDILCNREIKFDLFLKAALQIGADAVATGHYARVEKTGNVFRLLAGKDKNKDQSYFLCQLSQAQLAKALFPIGHLTKSEVRKIANEAGLETASKKDSQGLCFIGKVHLPDFLQQQLKPKQGKVLLVSPDETIFTTTEKYSPYHYSPNIGKLIGEHSGAHFYTIGQRKGLKLGGFPESLFVLHTDTKENIVYVGMGEQHPGLYRSGLRMALSHLHWVREDKRLREGESADFLVRIRYRQPLEKATLHIEKEFAYLLFDKPQRGITPGQFAAWYHEDELMGSGVIYS